jgi:hypothetical protein
MRENLINKYTNKVWLQAEAGLNSTTVGNGHEQQVDIHMNSCCTTTLLN